MKKKLALLFAVIITIVMVACANETESPADPPTDDSGQEQAVAPTDEAGQDDAVPDVEPATLSLFFQGPISGAPHPVGVQNDLVIERLREDTGATIDFFPTNTDEVLLTLLAGGELPDLTFISDLRHIPAVIQGGLAYRLDDLIDELGPDILANAPRKIDLARRLFSNDTGYLYGILGMAGPEGTPQNYVFGPQIRWDLYEQLGHPNIESYMDLLPLLQDMLELEPVNDDGRINYGISFNTDWDSTIPLQIMLMPAPMYGIQLENAWHAEVDNANGFAVSSMFTEDSWTMRGAEFIFEANQMGLVDPESMTQTWDTVSDKLLTGRMMFQSVNWPVGGFNHSMQEQGRDYRGFVPFFPNDATLLWCWVDELNGTDGMWVISSDTNHPELAMSVLNWLNSVEGSMAIYSGFEGIHWEMIDGEPVRPDEIELLFRGDEDWNEAQGVGKYWNMAGLTRGFPIPGTDGIGLSHALWPSTHRPSEINPIPEFLQNFLDFYGVYRPSQAYDLQKERVVVADRYGPLMETPPDHIAQIISRISAMANTEFYRMMFASDRAEFEAIRASIIQQAYDLGYQEQFDWIVEARERARLIWEESN